MKITVRQSGDVTILDLKGKITIGIGDVALRDSIAQQLQEGKRNLGRRRAGCRLHHGHQSRRALEAPPAAAEAAGHPADHPADHRLRSVRGRAQRHQVVLTAELR